MKIRSLDPATVEANKVADDYRRISLDLALAFQSDLQRAFEKIQAHPTRYPEYVLPKARLPLRWLKLKKFPYLVIYHIGSADVIWVIAIAHASRRPGYWRYRLNQPLD